MNTLLGDVREVGELGLGRQPQLEPRGVQPQTEQRREVYRSTLT
jgi:hypothetical protein